MTIRPLTAYLAIFTGIPEIPLAACVSPLIGISILAICIYTTLIPNRHLRYLRLLLSLPGFFCFVDFAWSTWYERMHNRTSFLALGTISCYGIMRLLETCWIRELDEDTPRWISKPMKVVEMETETKAKLTIWRDVAVNGGRNRNGLTRDRFVLQLPTRTWKRILYTLDLLTNVRGTSWFADRTWDFAPSYARTFVPPTGTSRIPFIFTQIKSMAVQYLVMDVIDTFIKSQLPSWNKASSSPVTTLNSILFQLAASFAVCCTTILYLTIPYAFMSASFVAMGSSPTSWPPIVFDPLSSRSLVDFWGRGWHHIFRRVFNRISMAILWPIRSSHKKHIPAARKTCIFLLSATLHLALLTTLQPRKPAVDNPHPRSHRSLVEMGTIKFFMAQPIGLFIESCVVQPLVRSLFGSSTRLQAHALRGFVWCWLLWTGRWWADAWIGGGMYDETEMPVIWSPFRGLIWGTWIL
ncbi:hypothetical protein FRB95_003969 [Tulasnella sp. JGI-2019a]|nr:hypothetical protein FRB95_003969 [Tulasnella sp. JGI-2019a]